MNIILSNIHEYHGYTSSLHLVLSLFLRGYFSKLTRQFPDERDTYWEKRVISEIKNGKNQSDYDAGAPRLHSTDHIYKDDYKSIDIYFILKIVLKNWYLNGSEKSIQKIYYSSVDTGSSIAFQRSLERCSKIGRNKPAHEAPDIYQQVTLKDVVDVCQEIGELCRYLPLEGNLELTSSVYELLLLIQYITEKQLSLPKEMWIPLDIERIMSRKGPNGRKICYVPQKIERVHERPIGTYGNSVNSEKTVQTVTTTPEVRRRKSTNASSGEEKKPTLTFIFAVVLTVLLLLIVCYLLVTLMSGSGYLWSYTWLIIPTLIIGICDFTLLRRVHKHGKYA